MHIKTLARVAVAAPLAGALLFSPPAQAAGPFTFTAGDGVLTSVVREAFTRTGCDPNGPAAAVNGTDGRFVSVNNLANRDIRLTWSAAANAGWLQPLFYTGGCSLAFALQNPTRIERQGTSTLRVPTGAQWMIIEGVGNAQVTFSFTAV